jgi:hypothetical protein
MKAVEDGDNRELTWAAGEAGLAIGVKPTDDSPSDRGLCCHPWT